jgi:hypothetical protein
LDLNSAYVAFVGVVTGVFICFSEEYFHLSLLFVILRNDRKLGTGRYTPADPAKKAHNA